MSLPAEFGSNLGSGSTSAQQPRGGYEYLVEPGKIGKGLIGFGLYRREWMSIKWPADPSIGNIEEDVFDPGTWKTEYPNPSFKQMDAADAFGAASIMSRFTHALVRARRGRRAADESRRDALSRQSRNQAPRQERALGHHQNEPARSI